MPIGSAIGLDEHRMFAGERVMTTSSGRPVMKLPKVRPVGNSLGAAPPEETTARLGDGLHPTDAPDGSIRTTPYAPALEVQMRVPREGIGCYRNALRKLAR